MARRIAAILYFVPGLGIAISTLLILAYQDRRGELPMTPFGWRLMGSTVPGMGADQLTPMGTALAWLLIGVSAVDAAAGRWLWQDRRRGTSGGSRDDSGQRRPGAAVPGAVPARRPAIAGRPRDRRLAAAVVRALGRWRQGTPGRRPCRCHDGPDARSRGVRV